MWTKWMIERRKTTRSRAPLDFSTRQVNSSNNFVCILCPLCPKLIPCAKFAQTERHRTALNTCRQTNEKNFIINLKSTYSSRRIFGNNIKPFTNRLCRYADDMEFGPCSVCCHFHVLARTKRRVTSCSEILLLRRWVRHTDTMALRQQQNQF